MCPVGVTSVSKSGISVSCWCDRRLCGMESTAEMSVGVVNKPVCRAWCGK